MLLNFADGAGKEVVEPLHRNARGFGLNGLLFHAPAAHEAPGVPYLAAEVAALLHLALIVEDVVAGGRAEQHADTHCVCTVFGYEIQRIRAVAQGLAHLAAQFVAHYTSEIHVGEWLPAHKLLARHDHSGYPEEDDVGAGYQVVRGIVVGQVAVRLVVRMAGRVGIEHADGPQPAAEPGVEHVFVLTKFGGGDAGNLLLRLRKGFFGRFSHHEAAVGQIPGRDALTPP